MPATRRTTARLAAIGCALAALLAFPGGSHAASCKYVAAAHTVVVSLPNATDVVDLRRVGNGFYDGSVPCAPTATVFNTDAIYVRDTTPKGDGDDFVGIDLSGGAFAPGSDDEGPNGVSEIQFLMFLQRGTNMVRVSGGGGPDHFDLGRTIDNNGYATGINLNAGAEQGKVADADVWFEPLSPPNTDEPLLIDGAGGDDTIDASGGPGFDTGLPTSITMLGSAGDDKLVGGSATDTLLTDKGDDALDGGQGIDYVDYQSSPNGIDLDLGETGPQDTGALGKDKLGCPGARARHFTRRHPDRRRQRQPARGWGGRRHAHGARRARLDCRWTGNRHRELSPPAPRDRRGSDRRPEQAGRAEERQRRRG